MFEEYISNNYLRAILIIVLIFISLKIFVFILEKIILKFTKKTKTDIDDIIVKKSSKPLSAIILLTGIRFALNEIPIQEGVYGIVTKIIYSFLIVLGGYLVYFIADSLILVAWKKFSSKTKSKIDDTLSSIIHSVLKVVWIVFVLLYILQLWGIEIGPFLAGLGIGGIAVAFALQESLGNIFGGVALIIDKTIKVGDIIYIDDDIKGEVLQIGLRSTRVKNWDNEVVIVPNSKVANGKIQNLGHPEPKSRAVVKFGVAYGSDIEKIKKIVLNEIKKIKHFSNKPSPVVRFMEMADSSLNFTAQFYVESYLYRIDAIDEANTRIYNALNKNGIEIPFPQMDVNLKKT